MDLVDFFLNHLHDRPEQQRELMETVIEVAIERLRGRYEYLEGFSNVIDLQNQIVEERSDAANAWLDFRDSLAILLALSEWPELLENSICGYDLEAIERIVKNRREQVEYVLARTREMKLYPSPSLLQPEPTQGSGDNENTTAPSQLSPRLRIIDLSRRRGRRPQYDWPMFAAEMARYCRVTVPADQAELEHHMKEWCAETWGLSRRIP